MPVFAKGSAELVIGSGVMAAWFYLVINDQQRLDQVEKALTGLNERSKKFKESITAVGTTKFHAGEEKIPSSKRGQ